jgi:hypothetical protein
MKVPIYQAAEVEWANRRVDVKCLLPNLWCSLGPEQRELSSHSSPFSLCRQPGSSDQFTRIYILTMSK